MNVKPTNMIDLLRHLGIGKAIWSPVRNELYIDEHTIQIVAPKGDLVYFQTTEESVKKLIEEAIEKVHKPRDIENGL